MNVHLSAGRPLLKKLIPLLRNLDRTSGKYLAWLVGCFIKRHQDTPSRAQKILCINLWGVGSSILTLPAIKALSQLYPGSEIAMLATARNQQVFQKQPFIQRIIQLKLTPWGLCRFVGRHFRQFDITVDFEEYFNITALIGALVSKFAIGFAHKGSRCCYSRSVACGHYTHATEMRYSLVRLLGITQDSIKLERVRYSHAADERVQHWLDRKELAGILYGIAPGAGESGRTRMWPCDRFAELIKTVSRKQDAQIVLIGASWDIPVANRILSLLTKEQRRTVVNACGRFDLEGTFALIDRLSLVITNDSGASHIASSLGRPLITLFGPNTPQRWGPLSKRSAVIYHALDCSPCIHSHLAVFPPCKWRNTSRSCQCMKAIEVEEVHERMMQLSQ